MLQLRGCLTVAVALFQVVAAKTLFSTIDQSSFGHRGKINERGSSIPNWLISGESYTPQLLSDRVVLTPPHPAHARGALWNEKPNVETEWSVELSFRANGQERGSGNINLFYAKDGKTAVGTNSAYTATKFEGLVLIVDARGDAGGMLRGFLNDGSINFRNHHMLDSLAFGFCTFPYRNLGKYSKLRVTHDSKGLSVYVNDGSCFSSEKVSLPAGYTFGITAATADNPDSFEVSQFIASKFLTTDAPAPKRPGGPAPPPSGNEQHRLPNAPEQLVDMDAGSIKKQEEQFADLHNRLQAMSHQLNNVFLEFDRVAKQVSEKQETILAKLPSSSGDNIAGLSRRLESIERSIQSLEKRAQGLDYNTHFDSLHQSVRDIKGGLSDQVKDGLHNVVKGSGFSITYLIVVIVAVQLVLGGLYYLYKRKIEGAPKKYL